MKATIVLLVLALIGMAAIAALSAQSITPVAVTHLATSTGEDPAWMILSGAALLGAASAVRRLSS
jgi:hypothetical protein